MDMPTDSTFRTIAAVFILGGILLLAYGGLAYARVDTDPFIGAEDGLADELPAEEAGQERSATPYLAGGISCLAVGIALLFVPGRATTTGVKRPKYHTQYR